MNTQITTENLQQGITEKKKAELDSLQNQVLNAQEEVEQQQIIVNSLTEKAQKFQAFLAVADNNRTAALNNRNLVDQAVQNAYDLSYNSMNAFDQTIVSTDDAKQVSSGMSDLINKLIYSVEIINKLSNLVTRKKALNPLISDDLLSRISTAETDANNAVSLTLVALQSAMASEASCLEAAAAITLEYKQALKLYTTLSGREPDFLNKNPDVIVNSGSVQYLLHKAYTDALKAYAKVNTANDETTKQLNFAAVNLSKAQIQLASLQAALAAANVAAIGS